MIFKGRAKRQKNLLYVNRDSFTFLQRGLFQKNAPKPIVLTLGEDVMKDMEIVSGEKFVQALSYWLDNSKIAPCDLVIVLSSDVYFEYAVQSLTQGKEEDDQIKMFLDAIPFEQSVSRVIVDDSAKRVVVLSRDCYDLLLEFLEKRYMRVLALLPASLVGIKALEDIKIDQIIKNLDDYKKFNFLSDFERRFVPESFISRNAPKNTRNLKIMIVLFSTLILILGVVLYLNYFRNA
ncbi:TPA: hypothetical protein DCY43_02990 [candidate division WWE3 bacterium]|uniref:Uncharacterized protein n=3 Tax=Katanobacteria TaxID=422282 RepID=A0A0G1NLM0_UNCKA|nr:MAG: hypothetical protein UW82_C0003G0007 [candidate division WWE3 bacterium GW2011_GWC2_44_9]OGC53384.1 MAG: hypothetical protein A2709_02230 [candidate division WWE3 bacterium RIFCSPHIGHO2_01_FULL_43_9]HAZ29689.1 hypothetical protein [candidate division WWE3 bacterium]